MADAEATFREREQALDSCLDLLRRTMPELAVRDLSDRAYHYKNQVLTWCYQLVREREVDGERQRVSVFLTYSEPLPQRDDLSILVRAEIFQQGQLSRVDRRHEERLPGKQIELTRVEGLVALAFDKGERLLVE